MRRLCLDSWKQRRVQDPHLAGCGQGGHGICRKELVGWPPGSSTFSNTFSHLPQCRPLF